MWRECWSLRRVSDKITVGKFQVVGSALVYIFRNSLRGQHRVRKKHPKE